jgi:hypothetical protein
LLAGVGGAGLLAVLFVRVWTHDSAPEPRIIYAGSGTQTTAPFYLAGGAYHTLWSAWERAPEYPPCTHSMGLMAVDPANATTSHGHVVDLAKLAQVPATGGSVEGYVVNLKAGQYFLEVHSECSWQVAISPSNDMR